MGLVAALDLVFTVAERVLDSELFATLGKALGTTVLARQDLTPEQRAEVIRCLAGYAAIKAVLEQEIAADQAKANPQ